MFVCPSDILSFAFMNVVILVFMITKHVLCNLNSHRKKNYLLTNKNAEVRYGLA